MPGLRHQNRRNGGVLSRFARRLSQAAMASIATILALNPLVCSYAAATQEVTNAALVFSLTELFEGGPAGYTNVTSAVLCARNMSDTPVVVRLIVENRSFPSPCVA